MDNIELKFSRHLGELKEIIANSASNSKSSIGNTKDISTEIDDLLSQIKVLPPPRLQIEGNSLSYRDMQELEWATVNSGFCISHGIDDVFIHMERLDVKCVGEYLGDKLHISVEKSKLIEAFELIAPILFSEDSIIDQWKITDLSKAKNSSRVTDGAQITLYIRPKHEDGVYRAGELHLLRYLVSKLELTLADNKIPIGKVPKSDVASPNWSYISYRHEFRSDRAGLVASSGALHKELVYVILAA